MFVAAGLKFNETLFFLGVGGAKKKRRVATGREGSLI
jgi:hypothetical protein